MAPMIPEINHEIDAGNSFLLTSHENPDGDALGSMLALANYMISLGKEVEIYSPDPVPENFLFLPLADTVSASVPKSSYDACFVLDSGSIARTGSEFRNNPPPGKILNIDHHQDNQQFGAVNFVDASASATGALIFRIIKAAGHPIDYNIGICIYTAIVADTGSFRYSNADAEAFFITGELLSLGINPWLISERLYESQPRTRLALLGLALSTLHTGSKGDVASISVTLDMYEKSGATPELTDGFINYPRSIRGVEVAVFFREIDDNCVKVGFRSKGTVDVSKLAAGFGGGGHHNAAGCKVSGTIDDVRNKVLSFLASNL